ncbi:MAG TPA: CorA family divalent cation transporter [Candidatus Absconditabacterales bacterium]|nr:CorA family divalent cation transporter [Candidatus Absconditabacterales bacterium]
MQKSLQIGKTQWIFIQTPDKETIDKLAQEYNLHEMIVNDILDINAQSKIDTSSNHFFLALTFTKYITQEDRYIFNELDVIIGDNLIITTTGLESQKLNDVFEEIKKDIKTIDRSYKTSPYYMLYRIIDAFYDKTLKSLSISSQKLLDIQININKRGENIIDELINEDLNKIFIKHNFLSQEEIIDELIDHVTNLHEKHLTTYFNDLKTKLAKITRTINVLTEKNDSLMTAYNTFLSIKSNKSVNRLTFINSIFLPLTVIAGIGGMSERTMMTGPENWKIAYPLFILLCIGIAYITYLILHKYFLRK